PGQLVVLGLVIHLEVEPLLDDHAEDHAVPVDPVAAEQRPGRDVAEGRQSIVYPIIGSFARHRRRLFTPRSAGVPSPSETPVRPPTHPPRRTAAGSWRPAWSP